MTEGDIPLSEETRIYDQYAAKIFRFFSNKVASPSDIDDLMQITFLRYFEKSRRELIHMPERYLYGIAQLVLLEYWRKRKRADLHDDVATLSLEQMGAGISTIMSQDEEHQRVLDALRSLRLEFQIVVELRYWERKSYQEIGEMLDVNPATVGVWLGRAKKQLAKQLLDEDTLAAVSDDPDSDASGTSPLREMLEKVREAASARDEGDEG